jgi:hypothetical protein
VYTSNTKKKVVKQIKTNLDTISKKVQAKNEAHVPAVKNKLILNS